MDTINDDKKYLKHIFYVSGYGYEVGNYKGEIFGTTLVFSGKGSSNIPNEPPAKKVTVYFDSKIPTKMPKYIVKNKTIAIYYPINLLDGVLDLLDRSSNIYI